MALVLVTAFQRHAEAALNQKLLSEIYGLLAAAEVTDSGQIQFPQQFPQVRFLRPDSGLVGEVFSTAGQSVWRSDSIGERQFAVPPHQPTGRPGFDQPTIDGGQWYRASLAIEWELADGQLVPLQFSVTENSAELQAEAHRFRVQVWRWLTAAIVMLVIVQSLIMRWGLAPLGRAAREINQIKSGRLQTLAGPYPAELLPLTQSLNALLEQQQVQLQRYRNALADATHSIKTPLAALRNELAAKDGQLQQLDHIDQLLEYQLKKAATVGPAALRLSLDIEPMVGRLIASLEKVYADRQLSFDITTQPGCQFPGDEGDFLELLGNLLDNACKWAGTRVGCVIGTPVLATGQVLNIEVTDDGPGVDSRISELLSRRGVQFDSPHGGQGIGLAVVRGILESYGGSLQIQQDPAQGTLFRAQIPLDGGEGELKLC